MKIIDKILELKTHVSPGDRSMSNSSTSSAASSLQDLQEEDALSSTMRSKPSLPSQLPKPPAQPEDPLQPPSTAPVNPYYSFEFFPPKTEAGLDNLYERIDRMKDLEPLFIDVTWGAGGGTERETVSIASYAQQYCGLDVLMHLTATGLTKEQIKRALESAKDAGVHNILALRGDAGKGHSTWTVHPEGFQNATELVRFIRSEYGDYFGIAVAGHPRATLMETVLAVTWYT